ncbi:MAG: hypothetical protein CL780_00370 [Chloroflexi bacterium]|nr:hypothetical protein [Chloroflexota bacterium]
MRSKNKTNKNEDVLIYSDNNNGVGIIQFNRPSKLNALRNKTLDFLEKYITEMNENDSVKVIIIKGSGGSFCSGVDIDELAGGVSKGPHKWSKDESVDELRRRFSQSHRIISMIYRSEKPYIAAIEGVAVGAGLDIACACDIRVSSEDAKFRSAYIKIGLFPGYGGIWLYQRLIGYGKASELVFTGRWMYAKEALNSGLLNYTFSKDDFQKKIMELATDISQSAPIALRLSKILMRDANTIDLEPSLRMASIAESITLSSEDHEEAMQALRQGRDPIFKGI